MDLVCRTLRPTVEHSGTRTCEGQLALTIFTLHVVADVPRGVAGSLQCSHTQTANL